MAKYGVDNFYIEAIASARSQNDADYLEIYFIEFLDSINNGYNIKGGGSCGKLNEESKRKISVANTGKIRTPEVRAKISVSSKGKPKSSETRAKMSAAALGKPKSTDARNKMSAAHKGKKLAPETVHKIAAAKNSAKITMVIAIQIREDYATGKWTYAQLGEKYGIDKTTIGMIIRGKTWKP
jgi:group I intron endonuclease